MAEKRFLVRLYQDSEVRVKSDEGDLGKLRRINSDQKNDFIVEIGDLLDSVRQSLENNVGSPSKLTIEFTGSITTSGKIEAGANIYIFNIGGGGERSREETVKISIETPLDSN